MIVCVRMAPSRWRWISVFGMSLYFGSKFFMKVCLLVQFYSGTYSLKQGSRLCLHSQSQHCLQQDIRAVYAIFPFGELTRRMTRSINRWDEDHANRAKICQRLSIVSRAGRE